MAERLGLDRDLGLVEMTSVRYHADQITTAGALPSIQRAKERGQDVTAVIYIHHLTLNDFDVGDFDIGLGLAGTHTLDSSFQSSATSSLIKCQGVYGDTCGNPNAGSPPSNTITYVARRSESGGGVTTATGPVASAGTRFVASGTGSTSAGVWD